MIRLFLLVALCFLLGRALYAFLSGIYPFARSSVMLYLLPAAFGVAILATLYAVVRTARSIRRGLHR